MLAYQLARRQLGFARSHWRGAHTGVLSNLKEGKIVNRKTMIWSCTMRGVMDVLAPCWRPTRSSVCF